MNTIEQLMANNFNDIERYESGWHSRYYMQAYNKIGGMLTIVNKPKKVQCFINLLQYVDNGQEPAYSSKCFGYGYSLDCENRAFALAVLTAARNIEYKSNVFTIPLGAGIVKAAKAIETSPIYGWLNRNYINERCPLESHVMSFLKSIQFITV